MNNTTGWVILHGLTLLLDAGIIGVSIYLAATLSLWWLLLLLLIAMTGYVSKEKQ